MERFTVEYDCGDDDNVPQYIVVEWDNGRFGHVRAKAYTYDLAVDHMCKLIAKFSTERLTNS
jgi:hypothetical protein